MTARESGRRLGRTTRAAREREEVPAVTGKVRSDGTISLAGDSTHNDALATNNVYIRLDGLEAETHVAYWTGLHSNLNVMVKRVRRGGRSHWLVTGVDYEGATASAGAVAGAAALPLIDGYVTPLRAYMRNIQEARLRVAATGGLNVTVDPFWYYDSAGALKVWEGENEPSGGTTLLAAPAASGGIDTQRWSIAAFNPDATTPAYVVYNGATNYISAALSLGDLETAFAAVANGYYVLGAVKVATGDTALIERDFVRPDPRVFLTKKGAGTTPVDATYITQTPNATLTNEQAMSALTTGLVKNTTTTGVQSIATPHTDYEPPLGAGVIKTLASDKAAAGSDRHLIIAAQTGTTDSLIEITGLSAGDRVIVRADAGDTITVKHNDAGATDKLLLRTALDLTLTGDNTIELVKTDTGKVVQPYAGLGTIATQDAAGVSITGGAIDGVTIGALAPKNAIFTDLSAKNFASIVKNNSGATVDAGDAGIVVYTVTNGWEYQRTTTANYPAASVGVVLVGGTNGADIYVAQNGRVGVNYTGSAPAIGDFLVTSTTGGSAQQQTTMRPDVFAVCIAAGTGGVVAARLLTQTTLVPLTSTNNIHQVSNASAGDFRAAITAVTATSVTYGAPSSGNENVINVTSGSELAKIRLFNETRGTYRPITSVNTATNVITTPSTTDAWANTDVITIRSQTNTGAPAASSFFYDLDLSTTTTVPLLARAIALSFVFVDSGAADQIGILHPYEADVASKRITLRNQVANIQYLAMPPALQLFDRKFCLGHGASGAGTADVTLRLLGYYLAT